MALTDESTGMIMPVAPAYSAGYGNGGFGMGGDWAWILLLLLIGGNGCGFGGGFGGGFGNMALGYDFPWLLNGQAGINANTNNGFQNALLNDNITSVRDGISALATQLCNCCGDMQMSMATGFAGVNQNLCNGFNGVNNSIFGAQAAISQQLNANQLADLERSYAAQTAATANATALQAQLAQCCCDNRQATADLKYTVATENCADRAALSDGIRDVLAATQAQTQAILDKMCQQELDAERRENQNLRSELMYARGQASQTEQTAAILANNNAQTALFQKGMNAEVDALYNRLSNCPVPAVPVYGSQRIFTCPQNQNAGCGCGSF
jgi:hypothetical protein